MGIGQPCQQTEYKPICFLGMGRSFAEGGIDKTPIIEGWVRLRQFLGRALRLGWARGPSATARMGKGAERCGHGLGYYYLFFCYLGLG